MRSYSEYIARRRGEHGDRFDESDLDRRFVRYFESGQRIKVRTCGLILTGTVSATTGWKPCFLLMRSTRSIGSPWTLGPKDEVLGVKNGRTYNHFSSHNTVPAL